MSITQEHPALEAGRIADLKTENRLVVSPMTRVSATADGTPTQEMAGYYEDFARGGFGLVITEGTYTDTVYSQGYLNQPGIVSDRHMAAWREITDRVHACGAPIVLQLMHAGALSQGNRHRDDTAGPSAVRPLAAKLPEYGGHGPWTRPTSKRRCVVSPPRRCGPARPASTGWRYTPPTATCSTSSSRPAPTPGAMK